MKNFFLFAYCLLPTAYCSAQMQPADSLMGTYAGQYWLANPATGPWVITPDTMLVTNIDSVNCLVQANLVMNNVSYGGNYYTDYYSCNGAPPSNFYMKFYNGDSAKRISDNVPQPPPNPPISRRFYGKRISNQITGVNELLNSEQITIYPNPSNGTLTIENKILNEEVEIKIIDAIGKENKKFKVKTGKTIIDTSDLKSGVYLMKIGTAKGILIKKFIIN